MSRTRCDGIRLDNNVYIQVERVLDAEPDQGHNRRMSIQSSPLAPAILLAGTPFTPGEQQLLATFVANTLHRLGSPAIERILVFGSRARGEGGEDSDLDLAVFVTRDAHRSIAREVSDIAESTQEGWEDLPHLRPIVIRNGDRTSRRLLDDIMQEGIELWAKTSA